MNLRGLMLDGRRKSIEPRTARLDDGDERCVQQFVSQSPWDHAAVRTNLARRMSGEIEPEAWIVDDTGFPKKGRWSVGVARQYPGTLERADNCQVGVSVSAASDEASCPVNWRSFIPEEWDQDGERRARAHVPEEIWRFGRVGGEVHLGSGIVRPAAAEVDERDEGVGGVEAEARGG